MKVLTNEQMKHVDERAQREWGIAEQLLMEEAGGAVARIATERFQPSRVVIVCGKGNNAGDGYVAARYLRQAGCEVNIVAVGAPKELRGSAAQAYEQARSASLSICELTHLPQCLEQADLVIDALCGTGIRGPLRGELAHAAREINHCGLPILAVDVPSGVRELAPGEDLGDVVHAQLTVAIGAPKLCSVLLPGADFVGELVVEPINFPPELLNAPELPLNIATITELKQWLPQRPPTANKGTFGKVAIVAGSAPFAGAAILAARGALRAGAGLVYIFTTDHLNSIFKVAMPEAVTVIVPSRDPHWLDETSLGPIIDEASRLDVVALGMGLGTSPSQEGLVRGILANVPGPKVVDADALTCLSRDLPVLDPSIVLTPHPGEMARLLQTDIADVQARRIEAAQQCAAKTLATVLLKGADTLIARPDGQVWINAGGCSALAKGGSGDVLSGVIAALIGQGLASWQAAILAARLHLEAGRACAAQGGHAGVLAREIADQIPKVMESWLEQE